jgi:Leucine-rich repeat (LRR) protein
MVIFAHLPQLRKLIFRNIFGNPAKFTDKGVVYLENMKYLEVLDLSETQITDAGLKHLKGLTKLQRLNLNDTDVTDAGVKDLQNALPNVKIDHGKDANRFLNPFTN